MELRVWVDGTQRVVCGVKLTTTCQEIVFALAHATQQAGRFTMIERWRNNERLLSPNEQPLVTLQRWGDHMNEVEFILRKTSSDAPSSQAPVNHIPPQHQPQPTKQQAPAVTTTTTDILRSNHDSEPTQQSAITNDGQGTTAGPITSSSNQQLLNDQTYDNMYQQRSYNLNRRPQTVLGSLTSSNSALSLGPNYLQNSQPVLNRLSTSFRPSLSASTLPNAANSMTASPSNSASTMRPRYADDQTITKNSPSILSNSHNGYSIQSETQFQQPKIANQTRSEQASKNYPFEDLYSTINKKRINQPPAVPAKPRVMNPLGNLPISQTINNAQMNYYQPNQSPISMYPGNLRPRHPPGYLDYLEAIANRNSLPQPIIPNYMHQSQNIQGNMFPRSYDLQQMYNIRHNGTSPANSSTTSNKYCYQVNGQSNNMNYGQCQDASSGVQNFNNPINSKLIDSGLVINRGSAVNVKLPSNSLNQSYSQNRVSADERLDNSTQSNVSSVSQMGLDMLKIIEEQKKVLINQKNELERLDNDQEYWEAKQNSEQAELINRIESEIRQLEDLWKENQTQIKKLENQDFEDELEKLKSEQVKMEMEIEKQKKKLTQCESDIVQCKSKIELLEAELASQVIDDFSSEDDTAESNSNRVDNDSMLKDSTKSKSDDLGPNCLNSNSNGSFATDGKEAKISDEEDSGGDVSDDLSSHNLDKKIRSAKDTAYVDKRGLISGIRSLKLDKSRPLMTTSTVLPNTKEKASIDNNIIETNGHYKEKAANNNKCEFLMTL